MEQHSAQRLTFTLKGSREDDGVVRAEDFVAWASGVLDCLKRLSEDLPETPVLKVSRLAIGSAVLAFDVESPSDGGRTARTLRGRFAEGYESLQRGRLAESGYPPETRRAFERLLIPLRRHIRSAEFVSNGSAVSIVADALPDTRVGPSASTAQVGRISGYVDAVNVHKTPVFYLYPSTGPARVKCTFDISLLPDVRDALKRYATVSGLLEYPDGNPFPDSVAVDSVKPSLADAELPTLRSLWGALPGFGGPDGGVSAIRQIRDAQE